METPDRKTLEEWDDRYVWHPFTPHSVYREEDPLLVVEADGHYLIDPEGNRYLDGVSSIWCNTFGHRRPEIDQAIRDQLDKVAHATMLGNATVPAIMLAKRLVELAPDGIEKCFFSDNGSTAAEIAMKMAYQYVQQEGSEANKKRTRFLALTNAYNGDTIGAVSLGGVDIFHERFRPMLFECIRGPSPYAYRCDMCAGQGGCNKSCLEETVGLIRKHADELVAVVLEPGMQGAGGIITYPDGYLQTIRAVTEELGILLILDEVAVGMGRSGKMFACEREGVVPDFICVAKMLTGGYVPVAATLTTQAVFDAFLAPPREGKTFFHGHTFTGNPLGCAAALAVLDIFENDDVIAKLEGKIAKFGERLHGMKALKPVGDTRQYGLGGGAEIVVDRESREPHPPEDRITQKICRAARDHGVFLRPLGNVLVFMPPLSITDDEIDVLFDAAEASIREVLVEEL